MMGEKLKIPDLQSAEVQKKTDADLKAIFATGSALDMIGFEKGGVWKSLEFRANFFARRR